MKRLSAVFVVFLPLLASAEVVVPIDSVRSHVNIRISEDTSSAVVGRLAQGEFLPLVDSTEDWHEVEITGGATGYISAGWVNILDEPPAVIAAVPARDESATVDSPDMALRDAIVADTTDTTIATGLNSASEISEIIISQTMDSADVTAATEATAINDSEVVTEIEAVAANPVAAGLETTTTDQVKDALDSGESLAEELSAEVESAEMGDIPVTVANGADASPVETTDLASDQIEDEPAPEAVLEGELQVDASDLAAPQGETGPPGPPGAANIEGSVGFLTRFTAPTSGGTSQIFDDGNNIGIGTTEPVQRLEVNGNIQIHEQNSSIAGLMITQSAGETGYIMHNRASTLTIGAGSIDRITIDRDGNVGFGVAQPAYPIEMASGAHVTSGGVWTNSSSRAHKENIENLSLTDAQAALADLEPVHFSYKNDQLDRYIGFIAEDVPELVATSDRQGLSSMDIVAVLTKVVQGQQKKIAELEARLDQL